MKSHIVIFLILALLGIIAYSNTFNVPFVLDDVSSIVYNKDIKSNDVFVKINQPRYIGIISFALNYRLNDLHVTGYHLFNLIIHFVNAFLVYLIARQLLIIIGDNKDWFACAVALLFLVHPVQTQAVTYIVQRFTSLAALFVLGSIFFYLAFRIGDNKRNLYFFISIFCALCAYKTKENTASLPLALFIIEFVLFKRTKIRLFKRILYLIPYIILIAVIPLSFMHANKPVKSILEEVVDKTYETPNISRAHYFFTELKVIVTYMRLLVIPIHQSLEYDYTLSHSLFDRNTFFAFLLIGALLFFAFYTIQKLPLISIGIFWFFTFLLIESSVIPISDVIAEHRMYLPSIGFIIAFAGMLLHVNKQNLKYFKALMIFLVLLLSVITYARNSVWNDNITLWKDAVSKYPHNARAYINLSGAYAGNGLLHEAINALKKAIIIDPNNKYAHFDLARCYKEIGLKVDAKKEADLAIELNPGNIDAYALLASLFMQEGDNTRAFEVLKKANKLDPFHSAINMMIGTIYCNSGNPETAFIFFNKSLEADASNVNAHFQSGICFISVRKFDDAKVQFLKAIELAPHLPDPYFFVAGLYDREGDISHAGFYYQQFLSKAFPSHRFYALAQERLLEINRRKEVE